MTEKGKMIASSGDDQNNVVPPWLRRIASIKFYSFCETHYSKRCNFYCRVCMVALCKKCKKKHERSKHQIIKAYKMVKMPSFRMVDLEPLWDISDICPQDRNGWLSAFLYKRGDGIARPRGQSDAAKCESCQHRLKRPGTKFCSVECKVEAVMKMNESGSVKNEAKRKAETISEEGASNAQSFRKRPRKQKNPQKAPFF